MHEQFIEPTKRYDIILKVERIRKESIFYVVIFTD